MSEQQPVTKTELLEALGGLRSGLHEQLRALEERVSGLHDELRALEERISERIHDTETRLLTAFHGCAERVDLRLRRVETA